MCSPKVRKQDAMKTTNKCEKETSSLDDRSQLPDPPTSWKMLASHPFSEDFIAAPHCEVDNLYSKKVSRLAKKKTEPLLVDQSNCSNTDKMSTRVGNGSSNKSSTSCACSSAFSLIVKQSLLLTMPPAIAPVHLTRCYLTRCWQQR